MPTQKFIQISQVPAHRRATAQLRARNEGITAVALSNDLFRVKSSRSILNVLNKFAVPNVDYYEVRTFDSDGELFATCTCPFGQKGEDGDTNICKHIEAALKVRPEKKPVFPTPTRIYKLPVFQDGKIVIDVSDADFLVRSFATNTDGSKAVSEATRRRRITRGTGLATFEKILEYLDTL